MAGSVAISPWFSAFHLHASLRTSTIWHPSSSSSSCESFSQAHEMSASTVGSRETRTVFRTCAAQKKSMVVKCATTCAILESEENFPSLYNLLGLHQDVTLPEIKTAYRQMARRYHPDVCSREKIEECTRRFLQVQDAYDTLSDPEKRAEYDFELLCSRSPGDAAGWRFQDRSARLSRSSSDKGYWRLKWEQQLEILTQRTATDHGSQSWGARMRRSNTSNQSFLQSPTVSSHTSPSSIW